MLHILYLAIFIYHYNLWNKVCRKQKRHTKEEFFCMPFRLNYEMDFNPQNYRTSLYLDTSPPYPGRQPQYFHGQSAEPS